MKQTWKWDAPTFNFQNIALFFQQVGEEVNDSETQEFAHQVRGHEIVHDDMKVSADYV